MMARREGGMKRRQGMARYGYVIAALVALSLSTGGGAAKAADVLRVGKSPAFLFAYVPIDVGLAKGFYKQRGVELEVIAFEGAAKMDMALTADSIDLALGSPMEMAAIEKGMPGIAIAAIAHPIRELALIVPTDSPIASLDGLRGKSIGIATIGSITQWAALELARVKGWGKDGIRRVAVGAGTAAHIAALRAHLVDATVANVMTGVVLEQRKQGRRLALVSDYAGPFVTHEMTAPQKTIRERPDALKRLLAGWMEAVAFMHENKEETVRIARGVTGLDQGQEELEYDLVLPEISVDGRHDPKDMARIGESFVELGILDKAPDMTKLYTNDFLPAR
jgi:NitT/TauT family transport system substrate-binding protein